MHTQVKIVNRTPGPLTIMDTWGPQVEKKRIRSTWKKGEDGLVKKHVLDVRQVPPAFNLLPGESVILPRSAANADQIVGLHRAGMISVSPVTAQDAPRTPAKAEVPKGTSPARDGQEEAREGHQDGDTEDGSASGTWKGRGKGKGKARD